MTKLWVDIPQGYLHGWPKLYDSEKDGTMLEWLEKNGCPDGVEWIRSWVEEVDDDVCAVYKEI